MPDKSKEERKTSSVWCEDCRDNVIIGPNRVFRVNKKDPYAPNTTHGFRCPRCEHVNYTLTYGNLYELEVS